MKRSKERFNYLFERYYSRTASLMEINELYELIRSFSSDKTIAKTLEKSYTNFKPSENDWIPLEREKILNAIFNFKEEEAVFVPLKRANYPIYKFIGVAAALILILSIVFYFQHLQEPNVILKVTSSIPQNTILPGGNNAILTLSDGSRIELNHHKNGILAKEGQMVIRKSGNGQITYLSEDNASAIEREHIFNTISTPRGGQYQVTLPDGTKVWLNAASSLQYPAIFSKSERVVQLIGEGYFEVAEDKTRPFHVTISGVDVQVLGTHFNIMGYNDENELKTSLLEGSVKITKGKLEHLLKPGQQGRIKNNASKIEVKTVDMEQVVAWKNGYFMFDQEDLKSVMRKLSRWYNVEVIYKGDFHGAVFSGTVSRFGDIAEVLQTLELTEMAHFKIEERRIIVMP